jgi:hypothetical protein
MVALMIQAFYDAPGALMNQRTTRHISEHAMLAVSLALAVWWVAVLASDAEAYIDPSAGGMLVQLLLAGTAGVAVLGRLFWMRIKRLFGGSDTAQPGASTSGTDRPHDGV